MGKINKQKTRTRKKHKKETNNELKADALHFLDANLSKAYSARQLTRRLGLTDNRSKAYMQSALEALEREGKIRQVFRNKYQSTTEPATLVGRVDYVNPRYAFIICDGLEYDIRVQSQDLMEALDGDLVKVISYGKGFRDRTPEGEVIELIERGRTEYVGRVELSKNYAFVVPDYKKMHMDIFVKPEDLKGAKDRDKVIVEITQWPTADKNPVGKVTNVLGPAGENNAEIHSIMAEFGLPLAFPQGVLNEVEKIKENITKKEIGKRRDFRDITTFTIDPEDAKDFDDALSFKKLDNGHLEIGIHIADVTHYVRPDTQVDEEGFSRATSVYLVDRVSPMLPERLSNFLCSLRPHEDKLTFSAVFEMDNDAKIINEWFGRTIIHSDHRFSYEEAQERLDTHKGRFSKELDTLNRLAHKLKKMRFDDGAINFETPEVKFRLDEKGNPLEVIPKVRKDAHKLIEEFMLLANKRVAEFVFNYKKREEKNTFVYRTHDYPDTEKLHDFAQFAQRFGYKLKLDAGSIANSINNLIQKIEGQPEENLLQSLAIRTMAKAKYSTDAKGHFGLAFEHYTHFTSPIRRYPDMMVHRLLQHYLDGGKPEDKEAYEKKCEHSSEMEKRAADAERASIKYKQVQFMQDKKDQPFAGIVSGVTEWGVFVEIIETKCEGLVRMADMRDDYYEFDSKNFRLIGKRKKRMITLGDKVNVRVIDTDIDRRTIDLEFVKS